MEQETVGQCLVLDSIGSFSMHVGQSEDVSPGKYQLLHTVSGMITLTVNHGEEISLAGDAVLLLQGSCHFQVLQASQDALAMVLTFSQAAALAGEYTLGDMLEHYPSYANFVKKKPPCIFFLDSSAVVISQLQSINASLQSTAQERATLVSSLLCSLLLSMMPLSAQQIQAPAANRHARDACRYIQTHYMLPITAQDVADHVQIHVSHLHRVFQGGTGIRVNTYLQQIRLRSAANQLMNTDLPIRQIAQRNGFATQQYFTRVFRDKMGIPPLVFRKTYNHTCNYHGYEQHNSQEVER